MNNKGLTITLIVILSFIAISLVGGMIFLLNSNTDFSNFKIFSAQSTKLIDEKEVNSINDLIINTDISDVEVEEKDINNIKIEFYSNTDKEEHSVTENGNNIEISFKVKRKFQIFSFGKSPVVKVYVPNNYSKLIKINSKVGDVRINSLPNADLEVKLTTGDVKVKEINNADVNGRTGDIKIGTVNKLNANITTGDIKVETVTDIEAKTNTGDIKIDTINNSLTLSTNTGDVKIENAAINENGKITSGTGDVRIRSISGCYIEGSTKVGDMHINNNDRKSDIVLKITSRVGDIDVN